MSDIKHVAQRVKMWVALDRKRAKTSVIVSQANKSGYEDEDEDDDDRL